MKKYTIPILVVCFSLCMMIGTSAKTVYLGKSNGFYHTMDLDTVHVMLYDPPNYIIQFKGKAEDPDMIVEVTWQYYYNYDKQQMKFHSLSGSGSDYEGNLIGRIPTNGPIEDVPSGSQGEVMGNLAFYKAYNIYFQKKWQDKLGTREVNTLKDIEDILD